MAYKGEIIDGKYEILHEIGRGGMSVVYLAMDRRLNKQWAIKEFRKDKDDASKKLALKALLDEANLMKKLDHPTLPRIVGITEEHNTIYVIMDYIEGESLNKVLDAYGAQPQEAVVEWAKQLCVVLDYLHTQSPPVIYRDMKPANIMLKPDGTVRLIDFGIAREYKEGKKGDTQHVGTHGYAAPEQINGDGQTDARTDIYSLGVTLYHLLTGKNPTEPPYEILPIRHWNPELSSALEWVVQKCTQLNPDDRFQSCAEISYILDNLEKFEVETSRKRKTRLNLFFASAAMTVALAVSSVGCFLGAKNVAENEYLAEYKRGNYVECIEQDEQRPEAYIGMVNDLRGRISTITVGSATQEQILARGPDEISHQEILNSFSTARMRYLEQNYPKEYVQISYELGRLFWNCYDSSSGKGAAAAEQALPYFQNVLVTVEGMEEQHGGLSAQKYNLAKAYYLISYFQVNRKNLVSVDDGHFEASEAAKLAGIYGIDPETKALDNPYYSYWVTCRNLLDLINSDQEMTEMVKLESLRRLTYILQENYDEFFTETKNRTEKVDAAAMAEMLKAIDRALENIETTEENRTIKQEIMDKLNNCIPYIEQQYDTELEEIG